MVTVTNPKGSEGGEIRNQVLGSIADIPTSSQEKLALLKELDEMMKKRYHQSLDDVLRDLYMHDVISKPDLNADEIVRTFESISVLKNETDTILRRFRR